MAEIIPESLVNSESATPGEKRVFSFLRDMLVPDEEFIVWYEPRLLSRYPDFIVWSQSLGLLLIEVKDWLPSQIKKMTPQHFDVDFTGQPEQRPSPLAQVRDAANQLMSKLKKVPSLTNPHGSYKDGLRFPVGYAVFWTNMTKVQADSLRLSEVIPADLTFYQDDLRLDVTRREEQRAFAARMKQAFTTWFDFNPLSGEELNLLRHVIFPEVRIQSVRRLRTEQDEEFLKTLDLRQEKTAKSIGAGHRILKGVAGSGKTLVLACRAKYLKSAQKNWKVLAVCYNISLSRYIRQLITATGPNGHCGEIEVIHFHGLVKKLTGANLQRHDKETDEDYDERVGQILLGRLAEGSIHKGSYDAILIDEGQDFQDTWMLGLTQLLNEKNDSLLFCYDEAQNVFGRRKPNWKQAGLKVKGKRPVTLETNYRNTAEILDTARAFLGAGEAGSSTVTEDEFDQQLIPVPVDRHGQPPMLVKKNNIEGVCGYILDTASGYIQNGACKWSDIGILYTQQKWMNFPDVLSAAFQRRFGSQSLYWATQSRENKINFDLTTPSAKLMTIESCKGLEFRVVFLVGLEIMPRKIKPADIERKLAYVGLTRAQDMLHVVYMQETGFVAELKSRAPVKMVS